MSKVKKMDLFKSKEMSAPITLSKEDVAVLVARNLLQKAVHVTNMVLKDLESVGEREYATTPAEVRTFVNNIIKMKGRLEDPDDRKLRMKLLSLDYSKSVVNEKYNEKLRRKAQKDFNSLTEKEKHYFDQLLKLDAENEKWKNDCFANLYKNEEGYEIEGFSFSSDEELEDNNSNVKLKRPNLYLDAEGYEIEGFSFSSDEELEDDNSNVKLKCPDLYLDAEDGSFKSE